MARQTTVSVADGDPGNNADLPSKMDAAVAGAKRIIGNDPAKPNTVQMAKSIAEIHTSPDDVIPAGTLLTPEVLEAADLDDKAVDGLLRRGHAVLVDVYASALTEGASA